MNERQQTPQEIFEEGRYSGMDLEALVELRKARKQQNDTEAVEVLDLAIQAIKEKATAEEASN